MAAERGRRTEQVTSRLDRDAHGAARDRSCCWPSSASSAIKIYLVMAILGVLISAAVYRIMLGVAQSVRQRLYVDAARVNGLGSLRGQPAARAAAAWRPSIAVQAAQLFGIGLLIQAGLAFLGFGPAEPAAELGRHDPGRLAAHLRRPVADGAHRCSCSR